MRYHRTVGLFTILAAGLLLSPMGLSIAAESDETASIDSEAKKVLHKLSEHISGLKSFSADIKQSMKMEMEGTKQELVTDQTLALQRPNKLAMKIKSGEFGSTTICDGKTVYDYLPITNAYTEREAPESLNDLSVAFTGGAEMNPFGLFNELFLGFLTKSDPFEDFMQGVTSLQIADGDDAKSHQLTAVKEELKFNLWITKGDNPLPQKITLDMSEVLKKAGAELPPQMKEMKMDMEIAFANWKTNIDLPEGTFTFTPPPGAQKTDSLLDPLTEGESGEDDTNTLLGKPAPTFTLELLNGGKFDLAAQKGKTIVILDFWATWCPPCRQALPAYEKLAEEYKNKGVLLIAVDLQEEADEITSFLKEQSLKPTVAIDRDGSVATLYKASAIPTTVIVGKDGTIQAVHIGYSPGTEDEMKRELDDLLAGKKLAEDSPDGDEPAKEEKP